MAFVRAIGRWTMTALVINCIIGGGIFGVPGELTRLLGRASPIAMIVAAIGMSVIVACVTEVAVQFSDAGGPYLYVRTALGRFLGMQVGWFHLLANIGAIAALSDLFIDYLPAVTGWKLNTWERGVLMAALIGIPAAANCLGVRSGAVLSNITTVAKLSPLVLLIVIGVAHFGTRPELIGISEIVSPGWAHWSSALVLLLFAFCGWEGALIPSGEIEEPRRTIPFSLAVGLLGCAAIYALLQFITVATVGTVPTSRPLADTASLLLGHNGAGFVAIAVMISTYGWISGAMLYSPRLAYALAEQDDFPAVFARLHPRFRSPVGAVLLHAIAGWVLAISGTFLWVAALSAGSSMVYYAATCASLLPLRRLRGNAVALRVPFAPVLSVLAIFISVGLMFGLTRGQLALMLVTALIATGNWLWARGQYTRAARSMKAAS
jgi:basic amino acid/polyamine antiporter, APA family